MQAHFTNCAGWKNIVKNAFVRLKLQENGCPIQSEPLTIQVFPYRLYSFPYSIGYYNTSFPYRYTPKETPYPRSAQILRKTIAKHHVAAGTNSPSTTNEKRTIQAYRDFLKREQSKPEHKAPNRYIEVGMSDLHRKQATYIPVNRGSQNAPPQRITPGG